jgi:hypothetical protein
MLLGADHKQQLAAITHTRCQDLIRQVMVCQSLFTGQKLRPICAPRAFFQHKQTAAKIQEKPCG